MCRNISWNNVAGTGVNIYRFFYTYCDIRNSNIKSKYLNKDINVEKINLMLRIFYGSNHPISEQR